MLIIIACVKILSKSKGVYDETIKRIHFEWDIDDDDTSGRVYTDSVWCVLPDDGILVVNGDDENCLDLPKYTNAKSITYGLNNPNVDFTAKNITFDDDGFSSFEVYKNNEFYENIKLHVTGMHNV